jgi:ribonuclease J
MGEQNKKQILYQFKNYKIKKEEISSDKGHIVMLVRQSMKKDLENIADIEGGNFIYSLWGGYLQKAVTKKFVEDLESRGFKTHHIHTSGYADIKTLQQMADAVKPKKIVPIHTFKGHEYKNYFSYPVMEVTDGEEVVI